MYPFQGIILLLAEQLPYMSTLYWKLFTSDVPIVDATVLADLGSEAGWTGYAAVLSGTWDTPTQVGPGASSINSTPPTFFNSSGSSQSFYVIALVDTTHGYLIWAQNVGLTTMPNGGTYSLAPTSKDQQL